MKTKKGFTLIELLVVVLIIGILAAIAVPQYQKAVLKSRLSNLKTIVSTVARAEEINYLSNNDYTIELNNLDISLPTPNETETTNNVNSFSYDWGLCRLSKNMIKCKDIKNGVQFGQYFQRTNHERKAKRECCAKTDSSAANSVCQSETGTTEAFFTGTDANTGYSISCYSYD